MSDKKNSEPNGVPNGSESNGSKSKSRTGRPPMQSDRDLLVLTNQLSTEKGRLPTADELIKASGGAQKARALAAIKQLSESQAKKTLAEKLEFPKEIETSLREQMTNWLDHAAAQMAVHQAAATEALEARLQQMELVVEESRSRFETEHAALSAANQRLDELMEEKNHLTQKLQNSEADVLRHKTLAEERQRLLEHFSVMMTVEAKSDDQASAQNSR